MNIQENWFEANKNCKSDNLFLRLRALNKQHDNTGSSESLEEPRHLEEPGGGPEADADEGPDEAETLGLAP